MTNEQQQRTTELRPVAPPCSLREACTSRGLDRGGQRCPTCPVRELCQSELRWLVKAAAIH